MDPRTGTLKGVNREFEGISLEEAVVRQAELRGAIRSGGRSDGRERAKYGDYATSLFERKLGTGELKSGKSRERWAQTQDGHLIPAFGDWYIDQIRRGDIEEWKAAQGARVEKGKLSPHTVNGWLRILLTTLERAIVEMDLEYDPTKGIRPLDTSTWHTYTEEEPNSLTVDEVPRFVACARTLHRSTSQCWRSVWRPGGGRRRCDPCAGRGRRPTSLDRRRASGAPLGNQGRSDGADQDRPAPSHPPPL